MNKQSIIAIAMGAALCGFLPLHGATAATAAAEPAQGESSTIDPRIQGFLERREVGVVLVEATIDPRIQGILEQELDKGLQQYHAKGGCMIAVDPKTGNILGMANRTETPDDGCFECQKIYEPGSTFKVVAATAALDTGKMKIDTRVDCTPFAVGNAPHITDGPANYGSLPLWGILAKSSNAGIARVALKCGWDSYKEYLHRYGLNMAMCDGGPCCNIPDGSNDVNLARMAHGQAVSVTPLHIAMVYAAIANNGVRVTPRIINTAAPQEGTRVMSEQTAADLRYALESVTQAENPDGVGSGTATAAAVSGVRIGGKTGTAKKADEKGGYIEGAYIVSFAGILPIDNPRMVIMTVIDEPHPTDCNPGGGSVAAPIFRAAAERILGRPATTTNAKQQ